MVFCCHRMWCPVSLASNISSNTPFEPAKDSARHSDWDHRSSDNARGSGGCTGAGIVIVRGCLLPWSLDAGGRHCGCQAQEPGRSEQPGRSYEPIRGAQAADWGGVQPPPLGHLRSCHGVCSEQLSHRPGQLLQPHTHTHMGCHLVHGFPGGRLHGAPFPPSCLPRASSGPGITCGGLRHPGPCGDGMASASGSGPPCAVRPAAPRGRRSPGGGMPGAGGDGFVAEGWRPFHAFLWRDPWPRPEGSHHQPSRCSQGSPHSSFQPSAGVDCVSC
mmetsp:Transcript_6690/g.18730  ORF Transcript_6690/g.18730 Transcript_6690/m.18730 type:complete len:273 (-) Transcript_6690:2344-3162(-)